MKNELIIDQFYSLRVGSFQFSTQGDFYDNLYKNQWLSVACCYENEKEIILIDGFHLPLSINVEQSFWDLVPNAAAHYSTKITQEVLIGLLRSAFDQDMDGLIDAGVDISRINIFPEIRIIDYSKVTHYSIVSKTFFSDEVIYDTRENVVILKNGNRLNLRDLCGWVEEDESWVVCVN